MSQQIPTTPYELCYDSRLDESEMDAIYGKYEAEQDQEFDEDLIKEEELDEVYD